MFQGFVDMGVLYLEPHLGFLFYQVAAIMSFIIILKYTLKIQILARMRIKAENEGDIQLQRHINYCINSKRPCSAFLTKLFYRDMWVGQKLPTIISHTD